MVLPRPCAIETIGQRETRRPVKPFIEFGGRARARSVTIKKPCDYARLEVLIGLCLVQST